MSISSAKAVYGLSAVGTPTSTGVSGTVLIGTTQSTESLTDATGAYCLSALIFGAGSTLILDTSDGTTVGSTAFVTGTAQVESATIVAAGGCTSNGTMTLVLTSTGMTGSPLNVDVALTTVAHTTAALIATAARTALAANTVIAALFTVGGAGADIVLTRVASATHTVPGGTLSQYVANDSALNLAIPGGLGVTAAASSANTTAGVETSGTKVYDGDGKDFEGSTLDTFIGLRALLFEEEGIGAATVTFGTETWELNQDSIILQTFTDKGADPYTVGTPSGTRVKITVIPA